MGKIHTRKLSSTFLIGIFVLAGSAVLIIVIIWLGASQFLQENVLYVTYFDSSVEGLNTGSAVKYQGVPIGTVKEIKVAPDGRLIEVVMQVEKQVVISDSLRVKAEMSGIAGGKFLQMYFPENMQIAELFPKLSFQPPYQLIKSSPSGMQEIEIAMREVLDNLRRIRFYDISNQTIAFLESSSKFFNNPLLYDIVAKIDSSAVSLHKLMKNADTSDIIDNVELTSQKLLQIAVELEYFTNNLNNQIENLDMAHKVDNVFIQLDSAIIESRKVIDVLGFRTESLLYGLNETIEEVKITNKQARKSLRVVSDNPSQVLFSEPPPKEK
ncbi:MAG: MlaD family protein [Bacteroidetes bacterium]|nr:MlaD family protein [Bacteroidota bacterium]